MTPPICKKRKAVDRGEPEKRSMSGLHPESSKRDSTNAVEPTRSAVVLQERPPTTSTRVIRDDLVHLAKTGRFDVIAHGCNCFNTMGAGIARQIRREFPEAYHADQATARGDRSKLGTFTSARIVVAASSKRGHSHAVTVVNGYTQYHYKQQSHSGQQQSQNGNVLVDYAALRKIFRQIKVQYSGKRIGYPKIGAGLAGGDWNRIASIIDQELHGEDHTLVLFGAP